MNPNDGSGLYGSKGGVGHYTEGINYGGRAGGHIRFYNAPSTAGAKKTSVPNYVKTLKKKDKIPLVFIGVNGKKGWW